MRRIKTLRRPRPRAQGSRDVRHRIRRQYGDDALDSWDLFCLDCSDFLVELVTETERQVFAEEFPTDFWRIFGFCGGSDEYPETAPPFSRQGFVEFLRQHRPRVQFEPPDLRQRPKGMSAHRACTQARAEWWVEAGLPLNEIERDWLAAQAGTHRESGREPIKVLTPRQ